MRIRRNLLTIVTLIAASLMLSACQQTYKAPKQPVVSLSELQLSEDGSRADFELVVRNDYEADYVVTGGDLVISIAGSPLLDLSPQEEVPIASYGVEVFVVEDRPIVDPGALRLLREMEHGYRDQISYHVYGRLEIDHEGGLNVDQRGQLHATPGRPGNFRGPAGINRGDPRLRGVRQR